MMESKTQKHIRSYFLVKVYHHLWPLEQAIKTVYDNDSDRLQLSVLGKIDNDCFSKNKKMIRAKNDLKNYWKGSLGEQIDFGLFCNPEIGTLFIAGTLTSQFLQDLDGRVLGTLSSGPYGILRGLGINESEAKNYIRKLSKGWYLMLVRGQRSDLKVIEDTLENIDE